MTIQRVVRREADLVEHRFLEAVDDVVVRVVSAEVRHDRVVSADLTGLVEPARAHLREMGWGEDRFERLQDVLVRSVLRCVRKGLLKLVTQEPRPVSVRILTASAVVPPKWVETRNWWR
jgi:hypothetical protein